MPRRHRWNGQPPSAGSATDRAYVAESGRLHDGTSHLNYALYHDRYRRTRDGWRFTERVYEIRYVDTSPLPGSAPRRLTGTACSQ
ncbi:nuclear transport factor 2 family protein [Kitasatospora cinereorecta]|uniref:Nuclear transport factor 2 family protein n=1 Tax=Kitasatospora cinereorecta TaxID=285560 RepID=A0ABW0VBJ2_9ACTN